MVANKSPAYLPDRSAVVIDNASYHSRITDDSRKPTTKFLKAEIVDWLVARGVRLPEKATKPELLEMSRGIFVKKEYEIETQTANYCRQYGKTIEIVRLPVGHSELNAIELIWAQCKNECARNKTTFSLTATKTAMAQALDNVSSDNWKKCIEHTINVNLLISKYLSRQYLLNFLSLLSHSSSPITLTITSFHLSLQSPSIPPILPFNSPHNQSIEIYLFE